jgi:hypothetical protein
MYMAEKKRRLSAAFGFVAIGGHEAAGETKEKFIDRIIRSNAEYKVSF